MADHPDNIAWVSPKRLVELANVKRSTWQNWSARGLPPAERKRGYGEGDVVDLVTVAAVSSVFPLKTVEALWQAMEQRGIPGKLKREVSRATHLDLVVDQRLILPHLATSDQEIADIVRDAADPRPFLVLPLARRLRLAREGFWTSAHYEARPRHVHASTTRNPRVGATQLHPR